MKIIIIITLSLFLSTLAFSQENSYLEKTNFETGIIFGYISSAGLFLEYNISDNLSLRASTYAIETDDLKLRNFDLTSRIIFNQSKHYEFYLTLNAGAARELYNLLVLVGLGLGYKYKLKSGINWFFELKGNYVLEPEKDKSSGLILLPAMGISVNF